MTWSGELPAEGLVIGRDPSCGLTLEHPALSRRHARVWADAGRVHVKDLQSANGTWVGDQRITQTALNTGQVFRVGQVMMSVELDLDPRVAKTLIVESGPSGPAVTPAPQPVRGASFQPPAQPRAFTPQPGFQMPAPAPQAPAPAPQAPAPAPAVAKPAPAVGAPVAAPEPAHAPVATEVDQYRRWGMAALWLVVGLGGAAGLLYGTGWYDDALRLYEGDLIAGEAPSATAEEVTAPAPETPTLPAAQPFEEL